MIEKHCTMSVQGLQQQALAEQMIQTVLAEVFAQTYEGMKISSIATETIFTKNALGTCAQGHRAVGQKLARQSEQHSHAEDIYGTASHHRRQQALSCTLARLRTMIRDTTVHKARSQYSRTLGPQAPEPHAHWPIMIVSG